MADEQVVLIVEQNPRVRAAIVNAFETRYIPTFDVGHAFDAMSALGRANFGAVVLTAGKRQLTLRGFCTLAYRRHPTADLFVIAEPGTKAAQLQEMLGVAKVHPVAPATTVEQLVDMICKQMEASYAELHSESNFDDIALTGFDEVDEVDVASQTGETAFDISVDDESQTDEITLPVDISLSDFSSTSEANADADESIIAKIDEDDTRSKAPVAVPLPILSSLNEDTQGSSSSPLAAGVASHVALTSTSPTVAPLAWAAPAEFSTEFEAAPGEVPLQHSDFATSGTPASWPLLEGTLHDKSGAALLLSVAAQELTGVLTIDEGDAQGSIYIHRGEPVWAVPKGGDAGLFDLLKGQEKIPQEAQFPNLPDGQLVAHLSAAGYLDGKALYEFMLRFVRDRLIALLDADGVNYAFYDDDAFMETAPLLTINPFGIVFECKRRDWSPELLMAMGSQLSDKYLHRLPAFIPVIERIEPFVRGGNLREFVNGTHTVHEFCSHTGLDVIMGMLVLISLEDARLVSIEDEPRQHQDKRVQLADNTGVHKMRLPTTDHAFSGQEENDDASENSSESSSEGENDEKVQATEGELLSLYMHLKPLQNPRQLLGLKDEQMLGDIDENDLRIAYEEMMRKLDPALVPQVASAALLQENIRQLRDKVTSAYQTLAQAAPMAGAEEI